MTVQEVAVLLGLDPDDVGLIIINGVQSEMEDPVPPDGRCVFVRPCQEDKERCIMQGGDGKHSRSYIRRTYPGSITPGSSGRRRYPIHGVNRSLGYSTEHPEGGSR